MIQVLINQEDFIRVDRALDAVEKVVLGLKDSIPEECAREFSNELVSNITSQRFGDFGAKRTSKWKKGLIHAGDYWLYLGTALKSIKPRKLASTVGVSKWFVGFEYKGGTVGGKEGLTNRSRLDLIKDRVKKLKESQSSSPVTKVDPKGYTLQKKTFGRTLSYK
jgi:hypothetical protein